MSSINRQIAELKGWKVECAIGGYRLTSPTGSHWSSKYDNATPDEVWDYCEAEGVLPDYEHDLNAAWPLFLELPGGLILNNHVTYDLGLDDDNYAGITGVFLGSNTPQCLAFVVSKMWLAINETTVTEQKEVT